MKKSKSLFKVYGTLFLASFLMVMSGAPHASAIGNQLTSSTQENAKTRVNPSSIRESLKNAPAEEWWVYGVVAGGNTHVYMRWIEAPATHMKLRIGNPNATGQTINGRLLQQWLREMSPTPVYIETLQEIHTAELTPIKVTDMTQLFYLNSNLTHLDISNFETKNVESMQQMFNGASSLKELDLSHFDTHNVRNVHRMFANMANLERLDISNFDSQHLQSVEYMFLGSNSLKILSLGHRFEFITPPPPLSGASLVQVPTNSLYSGKWQDVGTGSISKPEGSNVLTSEELMEQYNGETISGTYVWQPVIQ